MASHQRSRRSTCQRSGIPTLEWRVFGRPGVGHARNPILQVEAAGRVVDGIDFDRPDADLLGQELDASQCIEQEKGAQPAALSAAIDGEPAQQDDWDVDPRQSLGLIIGQILAANAMSGDRVVAQNLGRSLSNSHVSARQVPSIELAGSLFQPIVQRGMAAAERRSVVLAAQPGDHPGAFLDAIQIAVGTFPQRP